MSSLSSYFIVEFQSLDGSIDSFFYFGPSMDSSDWSSFILSVRKDAIKSLKKDGSSLSPSSVKFRIDRILKERGFFKRSLNLASFPSLVPSSSVSLVS